jgi:NO-binding membrane sensor protein with MHYT domain
VPAHVEHFTYGWLTPGLSYALSFLGALLGLVCTARARNTPDRGQRARWLVMAAWAIGGTGIWVMHFMAMIGFTVPGLPLVYDIPVTLASWITAVVVVGIGLFIVGYGRPTMPKILVAGVFTGVGVAGMHYTGMGAMRLAGEQHYDRNLVIASVVIAVVAATVALWFTVNMRRGSAITVAAAIMAVAVCGMHYTGMYALRVVVGAPTRPIKGISAITFLAPIALFVVAVIVTLFYALLNRAGADGPDEPFSGGEVGGGFPPPAEPTVPPTTRRTPPSTFVPRPVR